tara:strand:- start:6804 stop:7349 length:546 start_codon:yes stop_codon:yes gene_type:complete
MAGQRLTDKTELSGNPSGDDLLMLVDVSDTTGSADGTSKKIKTENYILTEKVSIDNSQFLLLASSGVKIVTERSATEVIVPIAVYCEYTEGATPSTNTHGGSIGYVDGDLINYWYQNKFMFTSPNYNGISWMLSGVFNTKGVLSTSSIGGKALYLYFTGAPSTGATGTIEVYTTYKIIDIS